MSTEYKKCNDPASPSMFFTAGFEPAPGLSKKELFCLHMGVAQTGDKELDAIIKKGNEQKAAMMVMQEFQQKNNDDSAPRDRFDAIDEALELVKGF